MLSSAGGQQYAYRTPKDVLVFGAIGDPRDLDPAKAYDTASSMIIDNIYEKLVDYKIVDGKWTPEIVPALAESWDVSKDGMTYTFHLRRNVTFHDGTKFNASAVVYSFERAKKMNLGPYGPVLGVAYGSARAIDEYTVEIKLKHPYQPFLQVLAHSVCAIVSPTAVEQHGGVEANTINQWMNTNMVGTGPFVLEKWTQGSEVLLRRNDKYWGQKPALNRVVIRTIKEPTTQMMNLQRGDIDIAEGLTLEEIDRIKKQGDPRVKIVQSDYVFTRQHLTINTERAPLNNKLVRQAIAYGMNYDAFIQGVLVGHGSRIYAMVPPGMIGYDETVKGYDYNLQRANQLLDQAGYPKGNNGMRNISLVYSYNEGNPVRQRVGVIFQSQMKDLGINVEIQPLSWPAWLDATDTGGFQIGFLGWQADYPAGDNMLYPLCHSDNVGPGGNSARYSNPEVDELIEQIMNETDEAKLKQLYRDAQEIINEDCPYIHMYVPEDNMAVGKWVNGFAYYPVGGHQFRYVTKA
jgi:peptide/nickel transport system substrate-binding protein